MSSEAQPQPHYNDLSHTDVYLSGFAAEHNLISAFIPFAYRDWNPIEVLAKLRAFVADKPITAATITNQRFYRELAPEHKNSLAPHLDVFWHVLSSWPVQIRKNDRNHWPNPRYVHARSFESITDPGDRARLARRYASLGLLEQSALARAWGVADSSVKDRVAEYGLPWQAWRQQGFERLARTLALYHTWDVSPRSAVANAFGMERSTLEYHIYNRVEYDELPDDPTEGLFE